MMATGQVIRTAGEVRAEVEAARDRGMSIGFVPTMGALHRGHEALIERSAAENDLTVISIFVNPAQFDDPSDLAAYPRSEDEDVAVATRSGAGICFVPSASEIYPDGHAVTVSLGGPLAGLYEGSERGPGHFDGVCTVLAILFAIVSPDVAYFGTKDAQQLAVVRQLVRDLALPLRVEAVATVREPDGLAMSSRNARLSASERPAALALSRALARAGTAVMQGSAVTGDEAAAVGLAALKELGASPEYFAAVDPLTFEPVQTPDADTLLLCAATVGGVRLIDNMTTADAAGTGYGPDRPGEES